jgi:hypothetical protein
MRPTNLREQPGQAPAKGTQARKRVEPLEDAAAAQPWARRERSRTTRPNMGRRRRARRVGAPGRSTSSGRSAPSHWPSGEPGVEARRRGNSAACRIEARAEEGRSERSAQAGAGRATGAAAVRVGREPSLWSIHAGACAAESEQRESS